MRPRTNHQSDRDEQSLAATNAAAGVKEDPGTPAASLRPEKALIDSKSQLDTVAYHSVLKQIVRLCCKRAKAPTDN
jgi:hypothetical protein